MVTIRTMTGADIPAVLRLKEQSGWNQLEPDIRRLLDLEPAGCFIGEHDGSVAGTTTTCVFGPVAWIAMVLVDDALRRRGIGTALMEHALSYLEGRGVETIRLDATPLGQPVYEKLGFVAEYRLSRWQGTMPAIGPTTGVEPARPADLDDIVSLDREVTSTDRRKLLLRLYEERPEQMRVVRRQGKIVGFATVRPGSKAFQVGPCLATVEAGLALLADAVGRCAGQTVFLDIPVAHTAAETLAGGWGLAVHRQLLRMSRGRPIQERIEQLWTSSGPEKG